MVKFDFLKFRKMTFNLELLNVSKMSSLRIYVSPVSRVNLILRVLLGTPPQKELTSLPHIHMTLSLVSGPTVINLGSENNSLAEVHRALIQCE